MSNLEEKTIPTLENVETSRTEAGAAGLLALSLGQAEGVSLESLEKMGAMVLPDGKRLVATKELRDAFRKAPERINGSAEHTELASFIAHAKRFATPASAVFAHPRGALVAVFDYHAPGVPDWCGHVSRYEPALSEEWKAWASGDRARDQKAFAEFLEDRIFDVRDPSSAGERAKEWAQASGSSFATPSKLLEVSRGLQLHVASKLLTAQNLATGETSFSYEEKHTAAEQDRGISVAIKVPSSFLLGIPVFVGGALYELPVRLRYRAQGGSGVSWTWTLHRAAGAIDHAFREAAAQVATETGLPVFFGTPE